MSRRPVQGKWSLPLWVRRQGVARKKRAREAERVRELEADGAEGFTSDKGHERPIYTHKQPEE